MPKPLMALVDPSSPPWSQFNNEGLQLIVDDFEDRLYKDNVDSSGVPSLFAHPIVFSKNLEKDEPSAFKIFSLLMKGIFLYVIKPEVIGGNELGVSLRAVVQGFQPGMDGFVILKWKEKAIGGIYPKSLVFPGVRITDDDLNMIELENDAKEKIFGSDTVRLHFRQWIEEITDGVADGIDRPLWANKLFQMTNQGGPWDVADINIGRPLAGTRMPLTRVRVIQNDNDKDLCDIPLVHYLEGVIVCPVGENNNRDVVLSEMNIGENLILGDGKRIKCLKGDRSLICEVCNIKGDGPEIEEVGFFERKRGQYVIWGKDFGTNALPGGCNGIEYFSDHAVLQFGKLKIEINGEVISKEDILCEKVYKFNDNIMPFLPVKSEYLDCVDLNGINLIGGAAYDITLKGKTHVTHTPEVKTGEMASILLFPSFNDPDWQVNYAFFNTSAALTEKETTATIALFSVNETGVKPLSKGIVIKHNAGIKTDLPVTHVEVLVDNEQVGIFKDSRPNAEAHGGSTSKELSLDFGTSNTILAVEDILGGGRKEQNPLTLEDKCFDILKNDEVDKKKIRDWWLPTYVPEASAPLSSGPSEVIFASKNDKNPVYLDQPILKYTIPHPSYERMDAYENVVLNFKWDVPEPFHGYNDSKKLRSSYLKLIMHMALAKLRGEGYRNISFTVTYPLAFGETKYIQYKTLFSGDTNNPGLIKELEKETGMTIEPRGYADWNNVEFIPESFAGKAQFSGSGRGYQLVVDVGGGTTDMALSKGQNEIIAYDSLLYGGNNYVNLLAEESLPAKLCLEPGHEELNKVHKIILLNKEIRKGKFSGYIIGELERVSRKRKSYILEKLHFFYKVLFHYIKLLLDGNKIRNNITIYPIGNAWRFIDAFQDVHGVSGYIERYFVEHGIKNISVNPAAIATGKQSVSTGALKINNLQLKRPNDPVKSVAGCDNIDIGNDIIKKDSQIPYCLKLNNHDQDSLPEVSTDGFINSLDWRPKKGVETIEIIEEFNQEIQNSLDFDEEKWRLKKSPFGIFMEKIVLKYYL